MHKFLKNIEIIISGAFLSITVLVVILNVILRYLFNTGLSWSEEVATLSFIWSVFVGIAAAYKNKVHIGIDILIKLFPPVAGKFVSVVVDVLMIVINGYIFYLSILFSLNSPLKTTPVLEVPFVYINMSITVGFGLITVYAFVYAIKDLQRLIDYKRDTKGEKSW